MYTYIIVNILYILYKYYIYYKCYKLHIFSYILYYIYICVCVFLNNLSSKILKDNQAKGIHGAVSKMFMASLKYLRPSVATR